MSSQIWKLYHSIEATFPQCCLFPGFSCGQVSVQLYWTAIPFQLRSVKKKKRFWGTPGSLILSSFLYILYCVCNKDNWLLLITNFGEPPTYETWRWQKWHFPFNLSSVGIEGFPSRTSTWKTHGLMQLSSWTLNIIIQNELIYFREN